MTAELHKRLFGHLAQRQMPVLLLEQTTENVPWFADLNIGGQFCTHIRVVSLLEDLDSHNDQLMFPIARNHAIPAQ